MTFLDRASPVATAGLTPATEDIETTTGELVGIGFQREALERNYWEARQRRAKDQRDRTLGDISEAVYGARDGWKAPPQDVPQDQGPQTIGSAMRAGEAAVAEDSATLDQLFKDLEALRAVDPGTFANFPGSVADLDSSIDAQISQDMRAELDELEARTDNRSSPNLLGGAADFAGMAGAAISDVEGLVTLPFGAGSGSLGRTMLIEGLLGAGSEALALPAYNAQAEFLGRDAPDPLVLLLFGASFGAALPVAGRAVRDGSGLAVRGARVSNQALLAGARKLTGNDKVRAAATAVAREEAILDSAPAGIDADLHADNLEQTEVMLDTGAPVVVRPDDVGAAQQVPIADRLMADLGDELGLEPFQIAGIVGNLAHESNGFNTLQEIAPLVPGSRGGFGYPQWTGPRRRAFEAWSAENGLDPRSYAANKGFLIHELKNTPEGAVLDRLRQTTNAAEAAQVFSDVFLRPGIPHMDSRFKWTERVLGGDIGTIEGQLSGDVPKFVRVGGPDGAGIAGRSAVYDGATFSADDNGFEIRVGEVSFARPWAPEKDRVFAAMTEAAQNAATGDYPARRPLTDWLSNGHRSTRNGNGSGRPSLQIDPEGPVGQELRAAGVTRRSYPRLFKIGGLQNIDNFPSQQWEADFPGITQATGSQDPSLNGYLSEQGLIDLLVRETAGDNAWLPSRADNDARQAEIDAYSTRKEQSAKVFDPTLNDGSPDQTREMIAEIETAIDVELSARGLTDLIDAEMREAIVQYILRNGGSVEDAIDDIRDVELRYAEADLESDDGRQFAEYTAADFERHTPSRAEPVSEGAGGVANAEPDAGTTRSGEASDPADRGRSESTEAGEQYLTPGVAPVSLRDQLEFQQSQTLTGGDAPAIDGLFDVNGRDQLDIFSGTNQPDVGADTRTPDLFDDPVESAGVAAQVDLAERDVRAFAAEPDNANRVFPTGGEDSPGLRVSDILQDIDDEAEFLEQLQICMPKGVANG